MRGVQLVLRRVCIQSSGVASKVLVFFQPAQLLAGGNEVLVSVNNGTGARQGRVALQGFQLGDCIAGLGRQLGSFGRVEVVLGSDFIEKRRVISEFGELAELRDLLALVLNGVLVSAILVVVVR